VKTWRDPCQAGLKRECNHDATAPFSAGNECLELEKKTILSRVLKHIGINNHSGQRRIGLLLLTSGIILILMTIQVEVGPQRREIHQISLRFTLTLSFRKERAYNYWWYSVLQGDKELRSQVAAQLFREVRKLHPYALIHNVTIQGYDDAVETRSYPYADSRYFIRRTRLKGHSIQISFQISNILVASINSVVNVTIPLRDVKLEAKTKIAASAYYGYLMQPNYMDEEVEVNLGEVFDFHAFGRAFHSRFWKRGSEGLHRFVREKCGIWGIIYKQMTISFLDESTGSSVIDRIGGSTVSFRGIIPSSNEGGIQSRRYYLTMSLIGLVVVGLEDKRRGRSLVSIIALTTILAVAHTPDLIGFFAKLNGGKEEDKQPDMEMEDGEIEDSTFNQLFVIERTPIIFDTITNVRPSAWTTPTVRRELNITRAFTTESGETEIIPVFSEAPSRSGCGGGIDPEGMEFLCVARLTYTQTVDHHVYTSMISPSLPAGYSMVSGRAWVRACNLATRTETILSEGFDSGWEVEIPWSIVGEGGNPHLRCRIPPTLTTGDYWSYKELEIPYYDPDTVESITLVFDEFRRKSDPGLIDMVADNSWFSYTEQPQCGSRGIDISLSSPHSGSFRFAWTCQRLESHSGGIAYPINYRVSNGDTILASWSVTRTSEAENANYGDGANNWPMGSGCALIIVDEQGSERNLILGQVNQDPRWGDSLGGTSGYGGSAQDVDVNALFQSTYERSLEGCTILKLYLYGWVGHCAWSGAGDYAFLDISFSNVHLKARREASARECIEVQSPLGGGSLASLVVHGAGDTADEDWELERSMDIPRGSWDELLGGTVRIALGVEYGGGDIDLLFDNIALKITFSRAKFTYSGGSLTVADQDPHEMPGYDGGEIVCSGADFDAELRCLVSKSLSTERHSMILEPHDKVSHLINLTAGYPSSAPQGIVFSDYNLTAILPCTYSRIRVADPAGKDITGQSVVSQYNSTNIQLVIGPRGFESSRYGTYRVTAESPNRVNRLYCENAGWNRIEFSWACMEGETVSNGEWTLYVYDPSGMEVFSRSGLNSETTALSPAGEMTLSEEMRHGTFRAVLIWHNGTEGGAAEAEFEVCSIRVECIDLDGNPLHQATVQISRDMEVVREVSTDGSGMVSQTLLPGEYSLGVRVDDNVVGGGSIDIQVGETFRTIQCSVCSPELRVVDGNGRPMVGAEISIISPNDSSKTVLTDGYGRALLEGTIVGNYTVSVLWRGMEVRNLTLRIRSSTTVPVVCDVYTLTISICDRGGTPLPYSTLIVDFPNGTERTATADSYGRVEFDQVPGGTHRFRVYWRGNEVSDETIHLSSSSPVVLYTTVEPAGTKRGENGLTGISWTGGGGSSEESTEERLVFCSLVIEVVDEKGNIVQGAEIKVIDLETGETISVMTTGADGTARTLITPGRYRLEARKGKSISEKVIDLRSDRTLRIILEFEERTKEETPPTIISAVIAIIGSALYLIYRRRSSG